MSFFEGLSDFFLGTSGEMKQESALTPEQEALLKGLTEQVQRGMTGEREQYSGQTPAQRDAEQAIRNELANTGGDFNQRFNAAYTEPAMQEFTNNILPSIGEQYAQTGSFWGSQRSEEQANAGANLAAALAKQREASRQQDYQNRMGLVEALNNIGNRQQEIEREEFVRTRPENNPYAQLALEMLNIPAMTQYYQEGQQGALPGLLRAGGNIAAGMATGGTGFFA